MVSKWWPMLGTFWGYCERVKQQTTEVNINLGVCVCVCMWTSASWLYLPWVWVWKCGILLVVTVHPEAQSYLRCLSTEIKIMMSIFPCFAPYLLFLFHVSHFLWKYYLQWRSTSGKGRKNKKRLVHTGRMDGFWDMPGSKWVGGDDERCIVAQVFTAKVCLWAWEKKDLAKLFVCVCYSILER